MKRWFAVLFLSILALNFAGIYLYFAFRLVHIKNDMRAALKTMPEESLTKLVMTEADFYRSRVEAHEIKVQGKMYDIARIEVNDGNVTVWCLHDEAEDSLLAFLDAVSSRAHQDSKPVPQSIHQFLSLTFLVPQFQFSFFSAAAAKSTIVYHLPQYAVSLAVLNPPPRF